MAFDYYNSGETTSGTIAVPLLLILFAILIVLIVIHYTITPIFKTRPGKGYIPVPGIRANGSLYWTSPVHDVLEERSTPLENVSQNYSLTVDFYFDDLTNGINKSSTQRLLFKRYNPASQATPNLEMYLEPQVNDLVVKVYTRDPITHSINHNIIKVHNIVAKTPIRIGVIMGANYFEVYRNGLLVGTRTLTSSPFNSTGIIEANPGTASASTASSACPSTNTSGPLGYAMNLNVWNRILSPAEMRYAGPAMPTAATFTM